MPAHIERQGHYKLLKTSRNHRIRNLDDDDRNVHRATGTEVWATENAKKTRR